MDTVAVFCAIDDFYQWFEPWWEQRLLESELTQPFAPAPMQVMGSASV